MIDVALENICHDLRMPLDLDHWAYRLRADPIFALQMRVCQEWRITHSQFLEWDVDDQEKAVAWVMHEASRCRECGIHPQDWPTDTEADPYEVEATRCFGCQELQRWTASYRDRTKVHGQDDPKSMWGLRTTLRAVRR